MNKHCRKDIRRRPYNRSPQIWVLATTLLLGCVGHRTPQTGLASKKPSAYQVGVVVAVGERYVSSFYTLAVEPISPGVVRITTIASEGTWEEGPVRAEFDMSAPKVSDPWPVAIQHAISSTPAEIQIGPNGVPEKMIDVDAWKEDAWQSFQALGLPHQARSSANALMDPKGVVADLLRSFPPAPEPTGVWRRTATIAGIDVMRVETCALSIERSVREWTCAGTTSSAATPRGKLLDIKTQSILTVDKMGIARLEETYDGVLVTRADGLGRVPHRVVAGKRVVSRIEEPPGTSAEPLGSTPELTP